MWSVAALTIVVSGLAVTASLLIAVVGLAVWIGFAHLLRQVTKVDRMPADRQSRVEIRATYRRPPGEASCLT